VKRGFTEDEFETGNPSAWAPLARLSLCFKQQWSGCQGNPPGKRAVQSRAVERIEAGIKDLTKQLVRRSALASLEFGDRGKHLY
jgi:hypothetical protein